MSLIREIKPIKFRTSGAGILTIASSVETLCLNWGAIVFCRSSFPLFSFLRRTMPWLSERVRGLFERPEPISNLRIQAQPTLTDEECVVFFAQLLEGVEQGWQLPEIERFFKALADRASETRWKSWLNTLARQHNTEPCISPEMAQRLIRFGELTNGELGKRAIELGTDVLAQPRLPSVTSANTAASEADAATAAVQEAERQAQQQQEQAAAQAQWIDWGRTQLQREKYESALLAFDQVIAIEPTHAAAWMYRGDALTELKRIQDATKAYEQSLQLNSNSAEAWSRLGDLQYELQRYALAIQSWKRAIELDDQDLDTWTNLGIAFGVGLGNWQEALQCWERVLASQPDNAEVLFRCGVALGALNEWEAALDRWEQALSINPTLKDAWLNKSIALQKLGREEEAQAAQQQAQTLDGTTATTPVSTVDTSATPEPEPETEPQVDPEQARIEAEELFDKGLEQYQLENFQAAQRFFERSLTHHPDRLLVLRYQGLTLKELSRYEDAIECWDQVLAVETNNGDLLALKAILLQELEQWDAANLIWDRVVELLPNNRDAWIQKGITLQKLGRYAEAIEANNRAMQDLNPDPSSNPEI